jgi:hypothetical protein
MGQPDQYLKHLLEHESPLVTGHAVEFVRAPEIKTSELRPDGIVRVLDRLRAKKLPAPWCLLREEAVADGKMRGDHTHPLALQRCLFRREARQVQRLDDPRVSARPEACAAWVVAPHVPRWLRAWAKRGWITLTRVAPGCWSIGPSMYPVLWIAANELPLDEALIPFLVVRTGAKLKEFVGWVLDKREPAWLAQMVYALPEVAAMIPPFEPDLSPEEQQRVLKALRKSFIGREFMKKGRARGLEKGLEKGLIPIERLFERRLTRALTPAEHDELKRRLDTAGAARIGDVVLDLAPDALAAWLADPDAR